MSYKPIASYGIIGDLYTVALVWLDGSIDFIESAEKTVGDMRWTIRRLDSAEAKVRIVIARLRDEDSSAVHARNLFPHTIMSSVPATPLKSTHDESFAGLPAHSD